MTLIALPETHEPGRHKFGAYTVTSALQGVVRDDHRTRQELLALTTRTDHAH